MMGRALPDGSLFLFLDIAATCRREACCCQCRIRITQLEVKRHIRAIDTTSFAFSSIGLSSISVTAFVSSRIPLAASNCGSVEKVFDLLLALSET